MDSELVSLIGDVLSLAGDREVNIEILRPARGKWQVVLLRGQRVAGAAAGNLTLALRDALEKYKKGLPRREAPCTLKPHDDLPS